MARPGSNPERQLFIEELACPGQLSWAGQPFSMYNKRGLTLNTVFNDRRQ